MMTRAHRTGLAAALALAACFTGAAPAHAGEPGPDTLPINIVAVQTADVYDQAEALTKALRLALKIVPGWSLAEGDYSLEVLTLSLKCGDIPDAGCQSRIADQIKADRYIWGNVQKKGPLVTGQLHLWVRGRGTTSTPVEYSANLTEANDEALRKVAMDAIQSLTGGPPRGSIHIRAGTLSGQVFIDGQPAGALVHGEGTFPAPAGSHQILVKAPGHHDVESSVIVKPTAVADVTLTPMPIEAEKPMNWKRIGGFIGVGAGAAFGLVGLVGVLQVNGVRNDSQMEEYKGLYSGDVDICAKARGEAQVTPDPRPGADPDVARLCDKAATFELLQAIFFPLAAISAGVGVYLLATSSDADAQPATGWTIRPSIGTESGRLSATYRW
jgi:hypothetical protein